MTSETSELVSKIVVRFDWVPSFRSMETVDVNVSGGRDQVKEPTVWRLIKQFDLRVNIKKASVDEDYGWLQLELSGPVEEIQRATAWLMTTGMHVEALRRAVGA